jgi:D-arabinose 1-dehydrogenase-like Zn-dependent alcohol dehydrogenase
MPTCPKCGSGNVREERLPPTPFTRGHPALGVVVGAIKLGVHIGRRMGVIPKSYRCNACKRQFDYESGQST